MNYLKNFVLICYGQKHNGEFKSGHYEVKFFDSLSHCLSEYKKIKSEDIAIFIKENNFQNKSYSDLLNIYYENEFTGSYDIMELHEFIIAYPELIEEILKEDHKNNFF